MANQLEKVLIKAVRKARDQYDEMTGGHWLSHAPETFIQFVIAREIFKADYYVFSDVSLKKVLNDVFRKAPGKIRGRQPHFLSQRSDLTVWNKSSETVRAVIEIKKAWNIGPLKKDALKLKKLSKMKNGPRRGYIIAYTEAKREGTLDKTFSSWAKRLKMRLVGSIQRRGNEHWYWGFAVLRSG